MPKNLTQKCCSRIPALVKDKNAALAHEYMKATGDGKAALITKKETQKRGCGKKKEHEEFFQKKEMENPQRNKGNHICVKDGD
jgi:hypothetical protein